MAVVYTMRGLIADRGSDLPVALPSTSLGSLVCSVVSVSFISSQRFNIVFCLISSLGKSGKVPHGRDNLAKN